MSQAPVPYTLFFFISTPFFWLSLDVLSFLAISALNVLQGVLSQIFQLRLSVYLAGQMLKYCSSRLIDNDDDKNNALHP